MNLIDEVAKIKQEGYSEANAQAKSGEYRNKFDRITNNINVNRTLYAKAKELLNHRSGTRYEDMYWVDAITGEVLASALNEQKELEIKK